MSASEAAEVSRQARALAGALRVGWRPVIDRARGRVIALSVLRAALDNGTRLLRLDPGVRVDPVQERCPDGSRSGRPVLGEWVRPPEPGTGAILYLHGGGYAFCSPRTHRMITSRLAADTGLPVLAPRYRLAPEHPFPAALDDALDAYRWLLASGVPGRRIVVAGDSSGGHLAASIVSEACRAGLPAPAGTVLFSPWVDLTCELSARRDRELRDPFINPELARQFGRLYAGGSWSDPRLSLLDRADVELPPFLIQVGGIEVLRGDAERLAQVLTENGNHCELRVWPGQIHVFQLFNRLLPEARAAMREAALFVRSAVSAESGERAA